MKKLLLLLLFGVNLLACTKSNEHTSGPVQVPSAVMSAYASRYPGASGQIEWEKEDGSTYKVKFFIGVEHWQAIFKGDGTLITEQQI